MSVVVAILLFFGAPVFIAGMLFGAAVAVFGENINKKRF